MSLKRFLIVSVPTSAGIFPFPMDTVQGQFPTDKHRNKAAMKAYEEYHGKCTLMMLTIFDGNPTVETYSENWLKRQSEMFKREQDGIEAYNRRIDQERANAIPEGI